MNIEKQMIAICGLFIVAAAFGGCETTMQTRSVEPSGFLTNTEQLQKGEGDQAQLVYFNPSADFSKYTKVLMEPVQLHAQPDSKLAQMDAEDQQALLDYFDAAVRERLQDDYQLVDTPGPDTLRLRLAVTEAHGSKPVMNTVSTIVPIGLAASTLKTAATGKPLAVAEVQAEMEVLDSATGERLAAAVDERVGRKITFRFDKFSKYAQVKDAFDYWAERIDTRLAELRSGQEPVS